MHRIATHEFGCHRIHGLNDGSFGENVADGIFPHFASGTLWWVGFLVSGFCVSGKKWWACNMWLMNLSDHTWYVTNLPKYVKYCHLGTILFDSSYITTKSWELEVYNSLCNSSVDGQDLGMSCERYEGSFNPTDLIESQYLHQATTFFPTTWDTSNLAKA